VAPIIQNAAPKQATPSINQNVASIIQNAAPKQATPPPIQQAAPEKVAPYPIESTAPIPSQNVALTPSKNAALHPVKNVVSVNQSSYASASHFSVIKSVNIQPVIQHLVGCFVIIISTLSARGIG
jgi:hypothetical protein